MTRVDQLPAACSFAEQTTGCSKDVPSARRIVVYDSIVQSKEIATLGAFEHDPQTRWSNELWLVGISHDSLS